MAGLQSIARNNLADNDGMTVKRLRRKQAPWIQPDATFDKK
jgi:hypothetical protein